MEVDHRTGRGTIPFGLILAPALCFSQTILFSDSLLIKR